MARWDFGSETWEREGISQPFRLKHYRKNSVSPAPQMPFDLLFNCKSHPESIEKCSSLFFPNAFEYCPDCGVKLSPPPPNSEKWIPPYGSGNGLKAISTEVNLDFELGAAFELPSNSGHFDFVVGAFTSQNRVLICLQRDIGKLFLYSDKSMKKWIDLSQKIQPSNLPSWSWASAMDKKENFWFVPTNSGPVALNFDIANNQFNFYESIAKSRKSIGGIAVYNNIAFAPILDNGSIRFLKFGANGKSTEWSQLDAVCQITNPEVDQENAIIFGVPIIDEDRDVIYWPLRSGYFTLNTSTHSISYSQWEYDEYPAKALIELGSPFKKIGSRSGYWQLCEDYDPRSRDKVVYKVLKLGGDSVTDSEVVQTGQFVTTGYSSFSWFYDFWDDIHKRSPGTSEQSELRFPILQLEEKNKLTLIAKLQSWTNKEHDFVLFTDLFNNKTNKDESYVRFVVEGSGIPEHPLYVEGISGKADNDGSLFRISVSELSELRAFVYANKLYVYLPERNESYCWHLN